MRKSLAEPLPAYDKQLEAVPSKPVVEKNKNLEKARINQTNMVCPSSASGMRTQQKRKWTLGKNMNILEGGTATMGG